MKRNIKLALAGGLGAATVAAMLVVPSQLVLSADHLDPPGRTDAAVDTTPDVPADIADVFAWADATNAYFAVTFAGPTPSTAGAYDRDVLYTLNISTAAPATSPEVNVRWRFGPATNGTGSGISIEGAPGVTGNIVGPVETVLSKDGVRAYAGVRDDPFFFDLEGFRTTRSTGTLSFSNQRNFFRAQNDTVVVFEIPKSRLGGDSNAIDVWATTARFGGNL